MARLPAAKNVTFVYRNYEGLGLGYLASYARSKGHHVRLALYPDPWADPYIWQKEAKSRFTGRIRRMVEEQLLREIVESQPDLVAFSVTTDDYQWSLRIARQIKKALDVPVLFGGVHVTSVPHRVIVREEVDYICLGEGERALVALLDHLDELQAGIDHYISGIWYQRDGTTIENGPGELIADLDALPFPAKDLFYDHLPILRRTYGVTTTRGCPNRCSYCHNAAMLPKYHKKGEANWLRQRSVDNVIEELLWAKRSFGMKHVMFMDDVFTLRQAWVEEFGEAYRRKIGVPFALATGAAFLKAGTIVALKKAGCVNMQLGIQTLNPETRKRIHRPETNKKLEEIFGLLKKHKLHFQVDHMLGIPGETAQDQVTAVRFYNRFKPDIVSVFWLKYYPALPIIDLAIEEGVLAPEQVELIEEGLNDESYLYCGDSPENRELRGFYFLYGYMWWLPRCVVNFLVDRERYRHLAHASYFLSVALPRLISCCTRRKDFRGRDHLRRTFGMFCYVARICLARLRNRGKSTKPIRQEKKRAPLERPRVGSVTLPVLNP